MDPLRDAIARRRSVDPPYWSARRPNRSFLRPWPASGSACSRRWDEHSQGSGERLSTLGLRSNSFVESRSASYLLVKAEAQTRSVRSRGSFRTPQLAPNSVSFEILLIGSRENAAFSDRTNISPRNFRSFASGAREKTESTGHVNANRKDSANETLGPRLVRPLAP